MGYINNIIVHENYSQLLRFYKQNLKIYTKKNVKMKKKRRTL